MCGKLHKYFGLRLIAEISIGREPKMARRTAVVSLLAHILIASCAESTKGNGYIAGGSSARPGQFPFIAAFRTIANQHICGGVTISNRWILTTAQCTLGRQNPSNHIAVVGAHTPRDGTPYNLEAIVVHPRFNRNWLHNNVALLRTLREIRFMAGRITPVRLPNIDHNDAQRIVVWTAGFGFTKVYTTIIIKKTSGQIPILTCLCIL